jgi:GNAT superfamily N-acetyltransferase
LLDGDAPLVQALCEQCRDYHVIVHGEPAGPGEGLKVLTELPPGKDMEDKFVFGFFDARGELKGVLDLVRDFRVPGEWYLGLLLLAPDVRHTGIGGSVLHATRDWLHAQGARSIRLGCAEQNADGRRFWEHHGFAPAKTFPPRQLGARQTVLIEYLRFL